MFARPRVIDGDLSPCDSIDSIAVLSCYLLTTCKELRAIRHALFKRLGPRRRSQPLRPIVNRGRIILTASSDLRGRSWQIKWIPSSVCATFALLRTVDSASGDKHLSAH